jgi:glutaredoxin
MGKGRNEEIMVYTLPECIFCNELKHHLRINDIPFKEINADDPNIQGHIDDIENRYQTQTYPIIVVVGIYLDEKYQYIIVRKSNLDSRRGFIILDDVEEIIKQIK